MKTGEHELRAIDYSMVVRIIALIINITKFGMFLSSIPKLRSISSDFKAKSGFKLQQQAVNARCEWQYWQPTFQGLSSAANLNSIHSKFRSVPSCFRF